MFITQAFSGQGYFHFFRKFLYKILSAFFFGVCFHSVDLKTHDEKVLSVCAAKGGTIGVVCVPDYLYVRNPEGGKYIYQP